MEWRTLAKNESLLLAESAKAYNQHIEEGLLDYIKLPPIDIDPNLFTQSEETLFCTTMKGRSVSPGYANAKMCITSYAPHSPQAQLIANLLDMQLCHVAFNVQLPDRLVGIHIDRNTLFANYTDFTIEQLRKCIIYVADWDIGQGVILGKSVHTDWHQGDVIEYPWYMPHATVNSSETSRPILVVEGIGLDNVQ